MRWKFNPFLSLKSALRQPPVRRLLNQFLKFCQAPRFDEFFFLLRCDGNRLANLLQKSILQPRLQPEFGLFFFLHYRRPTSYTSLFGLLLSLLQGPHRIDAGCLILRQPSLPAPVLRDPSEVRAQKKSSSAVVALASISSTTMSFAHQSFFS